MSDDPYDMRANSVYKLREELAFALTERDALRAENAKLREENAALPRLPKTIEKITRLQMENARLRAENAQLKDALLAEIKANVEFTRKQADEIARLREALRPFLEYPSLVDKDDIRAARTAMGETE